MADDDGMDGYTLDGLDVVPLGWSPDGVMAGLPAMNAAAGQSTLGAVMTPDQMAEVDWGDDGPPVVNPGAAVTAPAPPAVSGQAPGLSGPGSQPAPMTADQVDPDNVAVVQPVPSVPPKYLLDQLSKGEGTADDDPRVQKIYPSGSGYDAIYNYGQTAKPVSQMSLGEVQDQQAQMGKHTPVGRYQITAGTIPTLEKKLGLSDDTIFSPDIQDQMAQRLMADNGNWTGFINGQVSADQFGQNLKGTWSSLQKPDNMAAFQSVLSQVPRNK